MDDPFFGKFLVDLALRWLSTKPRMIDVELRRSVRDIGEHYQVDGVDFRKISDDRSATSSLHWWVRNDAVGLMGDVPNEKIAWAASRVMRNEAIRINRLEDMPPQAAAGRALMRESGVQAAIGVPLVVDDQVYGLLLLACQEPRDWSDAIEAELRVLGDAMAAVYVRAQRFNALWFSEDQLRAIVKNQTEFILRALPDGTRIWVNDSYCEYFQQSRESIIGTSYLPVVAPEDRDKTTEFMRSFTQENPVQTIEVRTLLPNGNLAWTAWTAKGIFDESGNLIEVQSAGRDITDRKLAAQALIESEQKYRQLFEASNDAILLLQNEIVIDCNQRATEMLGRDRTELIGMRPWEFSGDLQADGRSSEEYGKAIMSDVYSGKFMRFDWTHELPDGTRVETDVALTPLDLETEHPRIFAVVRDITTAKQAQREVLRSARFQTGLAEMSSRLLRNSIETSMHRIESELDYIGAQYGLGRITVDCARKREETAQRYLSWQSEAADSSPEDRPEKFVASPWFKDNVFKGHRIIVDDVDGLPDDAQGERALMLELGVRSLLVCPVQIDDERVGWCAFSCYEGCEWDEVTVQELGLLTDTIIRACVLAAATEQLLVSERNLALSQEVAHVGSYSITYDSSQSEVPSQGDLDVSDEFRELFALDQGPVSIEQALARVHRDDVERMQRSLSKVIRDGIKDVETFRVVLPDGTIRHVENRFLIIAGGLDGSKSVFGTCQDVTDRVNSTKKIENALAEIKVLKDKLHEENLHLRAEVKAAKGFDKIIGDSAKMRIALAAAEKVAPTEVPVLILGETGTGKELVAQGIHELSGRKDKPMVSVNCAALSRELIESELFGHEAGAFTGAQSRRSGRFERADGGILFLDEIGEMSGELQAKLLRVLQTGDFERLGGSKTINVDVRVIAATNRDLREAVDNGEFRADLYYRIASFPIELPPLRERKEDIPALAAHLVQKHAKRMGKKIDSISARMLRFLEEQEWPGNVRELEGLIQRALISTAGPVLDYTEAPVAGLETGDTSQSSMQRDAADLRTTERQHILRVLEGANWKIDGKRGAAERLGLAPSTLRSKMKRLNIERPN